MAVRDRKTADKFLRTHTSSTAPTDTEASLTYAAVSSYVAQQFALYQFKLPSEFVASDNRRVVSAVYEVPDAYGDAADGDLVVSAPTALSTCASLTADVLPNTSTIYVDDTSVFTAGDEILLINMQVFRQGTVTALGMHEYARIQSVAGPTTLILEANVQGTYLSDLTGFKSNNTKAQVVKVWNFGTLTLNADLTCSAWDGSKGGVLAFRAQVLAGASDLNVDGKGYSSTGTGVTCEGYLGLASQISGGGLSSGANEYHSGGGHLNTSSGYAYGLTTDQTESNPAMGGGGLSFRTLAYSEVHAGGGIVIGYVDDNTGFTGSVYSRSYQGGSSGYQTGAGGTVLLYTDSVVTFDTSVTSASASIGRQLTTAPAAASTSHYTLSYRVDSDRYQAESGSLLTYSALQSWINGLGTTEPVLDFYDPTSALPAAPTAGDRYISEATANGWTDNYIYEYDGSDWVETVPTAGNTAWSLADVLNFTFNGTGWVSASSTINHNLSTGLQGGTTAEYYHLTAAQHTGLTGITTAGKLLKTTAAGVLGESLLAEGSITGLLTLAKAGTTARTVTFQDAAYTVAGNNLDNVFSVAQTFRVAAGVRSEAAATQDAVVLAGRAGGTNSYAVTLTPAELTANHTVTLPNYDIVMSGSAAALTAGYIPVAAAGGLLADSDLAYASGVITRADAITLKTTNATTLTLGTNNVAYWVMSTAGNLSNSVASTSQRWLRLSNSAGAGDLYFGNESSVAGAFFTGSAAYENVFYTTGSFWLTASQCRFGISGAEKMRLTSGGALVINETAPVGSELLRVNGSTVLGDISIGAADGVITRAGEIRLSATGTNIITGYTNGSERWRTDSAGVFLVGTTASTAATAGTVVATRFQNSGTHTAGTILVNSSNGTDIDSVLGTMNGTGSMAITRFLKPSTTVSDGYNAARSVTAAPMAIEVGNGFIRMRGATSVAMTKDTAVTVSEFLRLTSGGALVINETAPVGSELLRVAGGSASTATATDVCIGGGSVNSGADSYFYGVRVGRGGGAVSTNTCVGSGAMAATATGTNDVVIGRSGFANLTSGIANSGIGDGVGGVTSGSYNTYAGYQCGRVHADGVTALTDPEKSIYIGAFARGYNNADDNSIVIGYNAIGKGANTAVWGNTSITNHYMAGGLILGDTSVGLIGSERLRVAGGSAATATATDVCIGGGSVNSGADSYFYGVRVGRGGGAVNLNTCVGNGAMAATATGSGNTEIGANAGAAITSGSNNIGIGYFAQARMATGGANIAIGYQCQYANGFSGTNNIAIGGAFAQLSLTTGTYNIAIGREAQYSLTTTSYSTAVGNSAARYQSGGTTALTESSNSLFLGANTKGTQAATNEIVVGYAAEGKGSNTAQWGNTSITNHYMAGNLNLLSDNGLLLLGAAGDASVTYDGTAMKIVTDLVAASDLDIDCGTEKTLRLVEPVYIDINFPAGAAQSPASSAPGIVTFLDNLGADTDIATKGFAEGEKLGWCLEYDHQCVTNGSLQFHIHVQCDDAPSGTDYVQFQIDYTITHDGETCAPVAQIVTGDITVDTQYEQVRGDWTALTGINLAIGDQIKVKLTRIAATGDAYAGECKLVTFGAHVQVDTLGSRTIAAK